jgi:hypothetical protein
MSLARIRGCDRRIGERRGVGCGRPRQALLMVACLSSL